MKNKAFTSFADLKKTTSAAFSPSFLGIYSVILYSLWSYLNVWEINFIHNEHIDYLRFFCTYLITLVLASLVFFLIYACTGFRSLERSLFATAAFMLIFLNYHSFSSISQNVWLYFIFLALLVGIVYFLAKNVIFRKVCFLLPCIGIASILFNALTSKYNYYNPIFASTSGTGIANGQLTDWSQSIYSNKSITPKHTPNVYFIIIDSLLRNDAFKRFYDTDGKDYDNFLSYAEQKGFYVVKNSYSNYPVTATSLSSTLNMDFMIWDNTQGPDELKNRKYPFYSDKTIYAALGGYNAVASAFRARGYEIYHTSNGFLPPSACGGYEDHCVKKNNFILFTQQELGLIKMTPLNLIFDMIQVNYGHTTPDDFMPDFRDDTIIFFHSFQPRDIPEYVPVNNKKPFFWYIHLMGMHNLAFGKNCEYQHPMAIAGRNPAPQCPTNPTRGCPVLVSYREQVSCMLSQLKFALDEIIERDPKAIIIVQSDHGSSVVNNFKERPTEEWTEKDVHEVFSNLDIIRCPADCQKMLYPDMTPVNTFRVIFSYIDEHKYPLLPDVSYIAAYRDWWPSYQLQPAKAGGLK